MEKDAVKIVFMGTPDFAVPVLDAIVKAGYKVVGVVTVADKPAGRGKKLKPSPVKEYAVKQGLKLMQPEKLRDENFINELKSLQPHIQVVVAFRMLPRVVWEIPSLGTFNLHASLLPQYRGAAPINYAIINGEPETGLTTFFIDDKIDTGNIILQQKIGIDKTDDFKSLHDKMMNAGAALVLKTIEAIVKGNVTLIDQETLADNYTTLKPAPKILKEDCKINWNKPVEDIYNFIRGLSPWPVAYTVFTDESGKEYYIKIYKVSFEKVHHVHQPGMVETDNKHYIKVYAADGVIIIESLQMSGKKRMMTEELLRGFSFSGEVKAIF
jgi:methionyl-tRNA formyltransferase